jgi:hypothetical protein
MVSAFSPKGAISSESEIVLFSCKQRDSSGQPQARASFALMRPLTIQLFNFGCGRIHPRAKARDDLAFAEGPGSVRACVEAAEAVETIKARAEEPANAAIEAAVERLAALSDADYELVRENEAERLGFRPKFLDKIVRQTKAANAPSPTDPAKQFSSVEP